MRQTWYERANRALAAAGMSGWMRITPTVQAAAVRLWMGRAAMRGLEVAHDSCLFFQQVTVQ